MTASKPTLQERKNALAARALAAMDAYYPNTNSDGATFSNWEIRKHWEAKSESRLKREVKRMERAVELLVKSKNAASDDERCFWGHAANGVWIGSATPYVFALRLYPEFEALVAEEV